MYKLFFLDPRINLGAVLTLILVFSAIPFAFGAVFLARFYKTGVKRSLWAGLGLALLPAPAAALGIQLFCWYLDYIGGPELTGLFN